MIIDAMDAHVDDPEVQAEACNALSLLFLPRMYDLRVVQFHLTDDQ
jgi:hypothetical protein